MSGKSNEKKSEVLGMPIGTAQGKLRKMVLFHLLKKHNENFCFQCGAEIETVETLSIEHKKPWVNEGADLFWDIENVAFSHLSCNSGAAIKRVQTATHGTETMYGKYGCRCEPCTTARKLYRREDRKRNGRHHSFKGENK